MNKSTSIRNYTVTVNSSGVNKGESIDLDSNYEKLTGIYCVKKSVNNFPKIETFSHDGNSDLIENGLPIEFLMSSDSLSPDKRFKEFDLVALKKKLQISVNDPGGNTYPYTLNFVYRLENKIR